MLNPSQLFLFSSPLRPPFPPQRQARPSGRAASAPLMPFSGPVDKSPKVYTQLAREGVVLTQDLSLIHI